MAQPAPRQHRRLREADERMRGGEDVHAGDDRGVDTTAAQADDCFVQRDEARRTGRIDGEARTVQIENIGDPVRDDRQRVCQSSCTRRPPRYRESAGWRGRDRRHRRRRPCRCPRASRAECPHPRALPRPARAAAAAADPSARPHAARCRRRRDRKPRYRRGRRPPRCSSCPARRRADGSSGPSTIDPRGSA